ncbi:hypothetical protein [Flavobacterium adhaerens]|uniref:hypothetical protein n=1 Tax=Flavobacterium adhaerens TaxID=3149043 RepID=UPI0032B41D5B
MKNSVLIIGIVIALSSNICLAMHIDSLSLKVFQKTILSNDTLKTQSGGDDIDENILPSDEIEIFYPETVIQYQPIAIEDVIYEGDKITENTVSDELEFMFYEESMRQIITQSELIIDSSVSNAVFPLFSERTIHDEITDLELIIESEQRNNEHPLDFKIINRKPSLSHSLATEKMVNMD